MNSNDRPFSPPTNYFTNYSFHHASSVPTVEVSNSGQGIVRRRKELWVEDSGGQLHRHVTIETLPDDILLEIFDFCEKGPKPYNSDDWWHTLVHVCRRWRTVVFGSPHRLNLRLVFTRRTSVKEMLDIWPEFPIIIWDNDLPEGVKRDVVDNVIAALELNDRVSNIFLDVSSAELERLVAAMQDPFPALTELWLVSTEEIEEMAPVISDWGGSAPHLETLWLESVGFPALPNLLLTATDIVNLRLFDIPHSGHMSPEAMVICLSMLTRLKSLVLEFQSPRSRPDRASQLSPPLTRTILPALTNLQFSGVTEYLEDLMAQIDAPLLDFIMITFFNQLIFAISQLPKFLSRTETFTVLDQATVSFYEEYIEVQLSRQTGANSARLYLGVSCRKLDWQLSALAQVCDPALSTLSALERLNLGPSIHAPDLLPGQDEIENTQWLDLLRPFTNVKNLHLSEQVAPCITPALEELTGEGIREVLPALQNLFLDSFEASRSVQEGIGQFVAARQRSDCPVAIHSWERGK